MIQKIKKTTWDFKPLLKNNFERQRKIIKKQCYKFINKWENRNDYLENPNILKQALDEYEKLQRNYLNGGDEGYYYWLKTQSDQNNTEIKAKYNSIEEFSKKIENDIQFFTLRIAKISKNIQGKFLKHEDLKSYRHFLERLFMESKYILSEPEEKILRLKEATSHSNWVKMLSGFLSKEERKVLLENGKNEIKSFSEIKSLTNSKNKKVRDIATKVLNEILVKHSDSAEVEMNSILANKKVDDELRNMPRPDFSRHISDDMDSEIVDTLVKTVSDRFDISKRYYKLKAKLLNVKKLEYHDRNVPYGKIEKNYNFQKSIDLVSNAFKNLDQEFADIFSKFIKNNQIDIYPRKGKKSGAFCAYGLIYQPIYITLNHSGELRDVLTLAHELGHGINDELVKKKQNSINFGTSIATAEVASTFMEDFVLDESLKISDDELKLAIMMMKLNEDVDTVFRQIALYKFEQELHKKFRQENYLSKEEIGKIFQKHMSAYMGDYVEQSIGSENCWIEWWHIRAFFYVYTYASGLLISKSLQSSVKKDKKFIKNIKEFLSTGISESPKNIFQKLGIDISKKEFWNNGLDEVEKLLEDTEKLAIKLNKKRRK